MRSFAASKPHRSQRKPARKHRGRLLQREQLRLHEATQLELGAEPRLQLGQPVHQFNEAFADVEFVVIEHESGEAVLAVQMLNLDEDRLRRAIADLPQALAVAAAAKPQPNGQPSWAIRLVARCPSML